jgi:hypothetical protein
VSLRAGLGIEAGGKILCPCRRLNSASYPVLSGGPFPGGKARPGVTLTTHPPSSAEAKNALDRHGPAHKVGLFFTHAET